MREKEYARERERGGGRGRENLCTENAIYTEQELAMCIAYLDVGNQTIE